MRNSLLWASALILGAVLVAIGDEPRAQSPSLTYADQGSGWDASQRQAFYATYQGSQIMPISWMKALSQPDGAPFLADNLGRYGYLPNPNGPSGLPVGFTLSSDAEAQVGMSCAACHTRQIELNGAAWRIDGGPAIVNFWAFLKDLDAAVQTALASDASFEVFADKVLGAGPSPAAVEQLRLDVEDWFKRYHSLIRLALPQSVAPWGYGRADAVQMIYNRLTGLDIGKTPDRIIVDNIQPADSPVRYPFLWNAPFEDKTQWMAFAPNGNPIFADFRNLGQVIGVFAHFEPQPGSFPIDFEYWAPGQNSISMDGLHSLEAWVQNIGPPQWPWSFPDPAAHDRLAKQGRTIYIANCSACHGKPSDSASRTTPVSAQADVKTDSRQLALLDRPADSGLISGDELFFARLHPTDAAINILRHAVLKTYIESFLPSSHAGSQLPSLSREQLIAMSKELQTPKVGYEARNLHGVWAVAPYLHNGSVPTLYDLLQPAARRPPSFLVGPEYDPVKVGLSATQPRFSSRTQTTDCSQISSGDSRCGHDYGTKLSPAQKQALLEYLKTY